MDTVNIPMYEKQLKEVIDQRLGYLSDNDKLDLCKTLMDLSRTLGNYEHSPEKMVSLVYTYISFARVDIKDTVRDYYGMREYFTTIYQWSNGKNYEPPVQRPANIGEPGRIVFTRTQTDPDFMKKEKALLKSLGFDFDKHK